MALRDNYEGKRRRSDAMLAHPSTRRVLSNVSDPIYLEQIVLTAGHLASTQAREPLFLQRRNQLDSGEGDYCRTERRRHRSR
jgi:hypothetical protein